jgi:AcrR family transcriptional regulator
MTAKRPRRTFDRILDVTLVMFNRFGEPNVSTSQLCGELGISPGNLFYHHPTRDALVAGLFERYRAALEATLARHAEGPPLPPPAEADAPIWWLDLDPAVARLAWLCEDLALTAWTYRFLFRDLSDLVSRHRVLEAGLPDLLRRQAQTLMLGLTMLPWRADQGDASTLHVWSGHLLASLTGCIGLDGALDPRELLRGTATQAVNRSVGRALGTLCSSLTDAARGPLAHHLSRGDLLGADPWWLLPADG